MKKNTSNLLVFSIRDEKVVEGGGFEPPKAEPSDLQSDPFGHSGTPPRGNQFIKLIENGT